MAQEHQFERHRPPMFYWALVFFIIALIAGVFGFSGVATTAGGLAQFAFVLFFILFLFSLIAGLARRRPISAHRRT